MKVKGVINFFAKWQVQLAILFLHILLSVIGFYNFVFNYRLSENYLTQSIYDKQQIIAKSGAKAIENFVNAIDNQLFSFLFSFTKIDENSPIDVPGTRLAFKDYIKRSKPPISGIALYDESGKLVIIENNENKNTGEGVNYSSSDFLTWAKDPQNKDKTFITKPFISAAGATKGQTIMAVVTPNYFGNKFKGTLAIRFLVGQFQEAFVNPLTTGLEEDSFIIDTDGTIIAGDPNLVNKNLFDYAKGLKWKGYQEFNDKLNSILKKDFINTSWSFAYPNQQVRNYLISSAKIDIPHTDKDLYLIISSPESGIFKPLSPLRYYGTIWIWISIILTFLGGVIYIVVKRLSS